MWVQFHTPPIFSGKISLLKIAAKGICDLCSDKATFNNKAGNPYLECHHITYLSENGKDDLQNCVALCPNCHAKMHALNLEEDKEKLLKIASQRYEKVFID